MTPEDQDVEDAREITEIHTDVKWIKKALEGNGKKGIIRQVEENTTWRLLVTGGLIVLSSLVAWGMINLHNLNKILG